jgi:hypothetical protein
VAVLGTDRVRRGWLIRPCRVRLRCGRPLAFARLEHPSPGLAAAVTQRVWACIELQWEWLGGEPPERVAGPTQDGRARPRGTGSRARAG